MIHTPIPSPAWNDVFVRELIQPRWADLDLILVQLWELHGVRTKAVYIGRMEEKEAACKLIFPEMTKRGSLEPVHLANFYPSQ